jgi:cystathionine beta-lyase/cystathionine gamma-synthase
MAQNMKREWHLETKIIHAGEPRPRIGGAVSVPIFQSSTFEFSGEGGYHDVRYIRLSNTPNHAVLHAKLAALEGGEAALVAASGMAAVSAVLFSVLSQGDHLLAHRSLYGGTQGFITSDLPKLGIDCTFVDADAPRSWQDALRPTTRAFYVETMSNPLLEVVDLDAVVAFCRANRMISVIDNTSATPVNFRPIEHGFDLVLHSASKYLNGHSDLVAGAVIGRAEPIAEIKHKLDHLGGSLDPHACSLLHRGLKTLALRVHRQNDSALRLASFLETHAAVRRVYYPGLPSHPRHARARDWFAGSGGLLSFELKGGIDAASRFFAHAELPVTAPSFGGTETLMTRPATTSHAGIPAEERERQGISDELIRVSVGLEEVQDLIDDFDRALRKVI